MQLSITPKTNPDWNKFSLISISVLHNNIPQEPIHHIHENQAAKRKTGRGHQYRVQTPQPGSSRPPATVCLHSPENVIVEHEKGKNKSQSIISFNFNLSSYLYHMFGCVHNAWCRSWFSVINNIETLSTYLAYFIITPN